jgi:aminodeoxyfutalosine synthase
MISTGMSVSDIELATLATTHDIINLGMLADGERRRRHGVRTTFVRVVTLPADSAGPHATPFQLPPAAGEVRIEGEPSSRAQVLERVREAAKIAGSTPLSGYSLADLEQLAGREKVTLRALLEDCRAAGLEIVAEAPIDLLHSARRSIEEVNIAGLALGRVSVQRQPDADAIALFKAVVALQREVGVIRVFAPLPRKINPAIPTTGYDDMKRIALARLVVDNVASIQVDWSLYGPKLAQVALTVGADDVDGVSAFDDMREGRRRAPLEEIRRNIVAAGQAPVERNGRFDPVSA